MWGEFSVARTFKNVDDSFKLAFWGLRGFNADAARIFFLDELVGLMSW